ncbi:MAG: TonB-dependent receptor [Bacteroidales bacterium]|nr:TonB-dependent receptor [Bacteroidales bacterium]
MPQETTGTCTGVVEDDLGDALIGATIRVVGTSLATATDMEGHFTLTNVPVGSKITVTYIGYDPIEVVWNGQPLSIVLKEDTHTLDEVVVVGFGTQKKVNLTGAVSTVSAKDITSRPVNSVVDALQGTVPGMNFAIGSGGGALNSEKTFNIRGTGTIGSGSSVTPLVLIDGLEGDLANINPNDVENISVLKDASASSIYGSRAAGGVILVTTKKGAKGKPTINYSDSFRFNSPLNMPEMMDSYTWALYMNDASINQGNGAWFSDERLAMIKKAQTDPSMQKMFANSAGYWEIFDEDDLLPLGNTDWLKEHFGNSFSQEHNLSVSGGSDVVNYYFSANYLGQSGILRHGDDNKRRYNVTGKMDIQIAKWLNFGYTTRFTRVDYNSPSWIVDGGLFYHNVARSWPIIPAYDPNGFAVADPNVGFINELQNGGDLKQQNDVFAQQFVARITPIDGLLINAEVNYRINNNRTHEDWQTTYKHDQNGNPVAVNNTTSSVYEYAYKSNYFNPNFYAEYTRDFGKHNFKVMAGYQSEWLRYSSITAQRDGIQAGLPTLDTTTSNPKLSGAYQNWSTMGVFGRLNYDYDGRYLLEANIRYDGSSRFTRDRRWNWFPSFSAGWNIAREAFWEDLIPVCNTLKLRASWGKLGNQNTDNWYPFYPTITVTPNGGGWLVNGSKPNISSEPALVSSLLTWEKSRTWEVGLDWGLLNNRLTGSFGYFQRKTYDMVGPAPELPDVLGTAVPKVNNLDMTSKGWDLQISWRDKIQEVIYGVTLTLSDNQVYIDKYPNDSKNIGSTYYAGAKLGQIWGFTTLGIAKTQEEMDAHLAKVDQSLLGSNWGAGDIMYADLDGDGKITQGTYTADDSGDYTIIGNTTPRYNFGLNLDASWRGFDIKVFFQGTLKRDYMASGAMFWGAIGQGKWQSIGLKAHEDYFRDDPNHPLGLNLDSYYPAANWGGGRNTYTQTRYIQNAAYCRLKNLTLGYTLPTNLTQKFACEKLRLFVSGENLFTITNFTDTSDPELVGVGQWGYGKTYPLSRTYSFGLNLTF